MRTSRISLRKALKLRVVAPLVLAIEPAPRLVNILRAFLPVLLAATPIAAFALEPPDAPRFAVEASPPLPGSEINWYCWYAPPARVACLLEAAPSSIETDGVDFESLQRLPRTVTELRTDPARVRGQRIEVPLHSPPIEMRSAALLARAVMCGSQRRCAVSFDAQANTARIAAILEDSGRIPVAESVSQRQTAVSIPESANRP